MSCGKAVLTPDEIAAMGRCRTCAHLGVFHLFDYGWECTALERECECESAVDDPPPPIVAGS